MKRPPREGEPALHHLTLNTGHDAEFAICDENYNPAVLKRMQSMTAEPLGGFRLTVLLSEPGIPFVVFAVDTEDYVTLSLNSCRLAAGDVWLQTRLNAAASERPLHEMPELADLEQCAALMLLQGAA